MPTVEFEPATPARERPQTNALDRIGKCEITRLNTQVWSHDTVRPVAVWNETSASPSTDGTSSIRQFNNVLPISHETERCTPTCLPLPLWYFTTHFVSQLVRDVIPLQRTIYFTITSSSFIVMFYFSFHNLKSNRSHVSECNKNLLHGLTNRIVYIYIYIYTVNKSEKFKYCQKETAKCQEEVTVRGECG
jgi:hypothetical protein